MKHLIAAWKLPVLCFLILAGLTSSSYGQKESLLFYVSGGPAFPIDESNLKAGWSVGGGLGFVLTSEAEFSLELVARGDWYRFSKDSDIARYFPQYNLGHENHGSLSLELRFRRNLLRFFNPFATFGFGFYEFNSSMMLGLGSDLGTGPDGKRLLFWEVRYVPSPYTIIRLHAGIRLG